MHEHGVTQTCYRWSFRLPLRIGYIFSICTWSGELNRNNHTAFRLGRYLALTLSRSNAACECYATSLVWGKTLNHVRDHVL